MEDLVLKYYALYCQARLLFVESEIVTLRAQRREFTHIQLINFKRKLSEIVTGSVLFKSSLLEGKLTVF